MCDELLGFRYEIDDRGGEGGVVTWEFPGVIFVEIDLGDDRGGERGVGGLLLEVVNQELFVGGVEAEARWHLRVVVAAAGAGALHGS